MDFVSAASRLPKSIPFLHHGRDVNGLDCLGLAFWLYREAGSPRDDLDQPYSVKDTARKHRTTRIVASLLSQFEPISTSGPFQSGDLLLLGHGHMGIVVEKLLYQMEPSGLKVSLVRKVLPFITSAFRSK